MAGLEIGFVPGLHGRGLGGGVEGAGGGGRAGGGSAATAILVDGVDNRPRAVVGSGRTGRESRGGCGGSARATTSGGAGGGLPVRESRSKSLDARFARDVGVGRWLQLEAGAGREGMATGEAGPGAGGGGRCRRAADGLEC